MNGTPAARVVRSVQLAVLATPTTSVVAAVAEARRRHEPVVVIIPRGTARVSLAPAS